jgi:hypothetical protein
MGGKSGGKGWGGEEGLTDELDKAERTLISNLYNRLVPHIYIYGEMRVRSNSCAELEQAYFGRSNIIFINVNLKRLLYKMKLKHSPNAPRRGGDRNTSSSLDKGLYI